jgi:hypothetical protein
VTDYIVAPYQQVTCQKDTANPTAARLSECLRHLDPERVWIYMPYDLAVRVLAYTGSEKRQVKLKLPIGTHKL